VFVAALQRADELALAMEARGYHGNSPRSYYSRLHFGLAEYLFMSFSCIAIITLFIVTK
jgi:energy-coupling factor transporter transmembrane protein EcfT